MSEHRELPWVDLARLMTHPQVSEPTLKGIIRSHRSTEEPENSMSWGVLDPAGSPPLFTGLNHYQTRAPDQPASPTNDIRVWRAGPKVRVERANHTPHLITDGVTAWTFTTTETPAEATRDARLEFAGAGTHLLRRRTAAELASTEYAKPSGPILRGQFLNRPMWRVEFETDSNSRRHLTLFVDETTGLVLHQSNEHTGAIDEWVELTVGDQLSPALFRYDGPTRMAAQRQAHERIEDEQQQGEKQDWFSRWVTATPLTGEVEISLPLNLLRRTAGDPGGFEASIGTDRGLRGTLARRTRSNSQWELGWATVDHRWSTQHWDWSLTIDQATLTETGLRAIQNHLGDPESPPNPKT